jgi:2-methylcitrate dehydratase PrpD
MGALNAHGGRTPSAPDASITEAWAGLIAGTDAGKLPPAVIAAAKDRLIDCVATAIAARDLPVPAVVRQFVGDNRGPATVIGSSRSVPAIDAAFLNAVLINGCTHDDFLAKSHAGAVTVPAALALAEEQGDVPGRELLASIVLGYEVVARAYLGGPAMLPRFRATGVTGTFGAAAAAARLMRLPQEQVAHALGLAAMFASGFGEGFLTGTKDVKLNVGWASRSGVSAAQLARCGATAASRVMEGPSGFYRAFSNGVEHVQQAVRGLGERFLIEDSVYKERPVCIFVQTPVELARRMAMEHRLDARDIRRVRIRAPLATLTNPGYQNVAPFATQLQARISVRFTVAAALLGRPVERYDYYDATDDAQVLALAQRIDLLEPQSETQVCVEVEADRTYELRGEEMDHLRPSLEKTVAKYRRLTDGLPAGTRDDLLDALLHVEEAPDVSRMTRLLRAI